MQHLTDTRIELRQIYPASFIAISEHDDYRQPLLPDHPPEVSNGVGQGAWR